MRDCTVSEFAQETVLDRCPARLCTSLTAQDLEGNDTLGHCAWRSKRRSAFGRAFATNAKLAKY